MDRCGFIGLGIMGKPMARNLLAKGCPVMVHDLDHRAVEDLASEGAVAATPAEMGRSCGIVFTILPNGAIVKDVLFGSGGIAQEMKPGGLVVDMSSVTPSESRECAEILSKTGIGFMDSPVSGGEPKAIDGTLAFMAGGRQEDFDRALPYFELMGSSAVLIGSHGSGSITKLTNQVIVNLTIAAVSEAFVLAAKAGADPEKVYRAIRGGLAGSAVLDAKLPMMVSRNFKPGGKLAINLKDIKNVMATAHGIDVPMPLTGQLLEIMQALKVGGHLDEDHCCLVRYFEQLAGVMVEKCPNGGESP
jgi:2-hydroxy-3-oxopropionate reductase